MTTATLALGMVVFARSAFFQARIYRPPRGADTTTKPSSVFDRQVRAWTVVGPARALRIRKSAVHAVPQVAVFTVDAILSYCLICEVTSVAQTQTVSAGKKQLSVGLSCQWVLLNPQEQLVIGLCDDLTEVTRDAS